jgi:hypothetical protein
VKGQFEGADSNLLANSNHVTSLVVTNPQANGEKKQKNELAEIHGLNFY